MSTLKERLGPPPGQPVNAGQLREMPELQKLNPFINSHEMTHVTHFPGRVNEPRNDREAAFALSEQAKGFGPSDQQMETIKKLETPESAQWTFEGQDGRGR